MRTEPDVTVLDFQWEGPLTVEKAQTASEASDYGLYQIYGTHAVFGSDALLYIGLSDRKLGIRLAEHYKNWIKWENCVTAIYFGRMGGITQLEESQHIAWGENIRRAESLLIYYCSPPYNSDGIRNLPKFPATAVLNFRKRHRLPMIVSNLYEHSPVDDDRFKLYSNKKI
jgi:hypothetical protein